MLLPLIRMGLARIFLLLSFSAFLAEAAAERINQEGRILGPAPLVSAPILFNHPGSRRGCRGDADHAGDESLE